MSVDLLRMLQEEPLGILQLLRDRQQQQIWRIHPISLQVFPPCYKGSLTDGHTRSNRCREPFMCHSKFIAVFETFAMKRIISVCLCCYQCCIFPQWLLETEGPHFNTRDNSIVIRCNNNRDFLSLRSFSLDNTHAWYSTVYYRIMLCNESRCILLRHHQVQSAPARWPF